MRKRNFRLRTTAVAMGSPVVVLTYDLRDVQPWKQRVSQYQTAIYRADGSGMAMGGPLAAVVEYKSEHDARRGHLGLVESLRKEASLAGEGSLLAALPRAG